ncbi:hypothetical protein D9M68_904730 [compost metagenome]
MYINGLQFQLKIIFVDLRSLQNFFNLLVHALIFRFNDAGIIVQHIGVFAHFLHRQCIGCQGYGRQWCFKLMRHVVDKVRLDFCDLFLVKHGADGQCKSRNNDNRK